MTRLTCDSTRAENGTVAATAPAPVSTARREKRVFVLKEEVGTLPRFFYYFDV